MKSPFEKITLLHACGHEQKHFLEKVNAFNKKYLAALRIRNCAECSKKNEIDLTKKPEGDNPCQ